LDANGHPGLFNEHNRLIIRNAIQSQSVRLSASQAPPPRRSDDGQAILEHPKMILNLDPDLVKRVELWGFEPLASDRKITASAMAAADPGLVTGGRPGWSGGVGEGDGESGRFELADVAAGLAVLAGAAGVVAGAQLAEAGGGAGEQVVRR
jgi:hypothetical protein